MEQGVWQEIELLYQKFQKLGISEAVDYDKYYLYSLITHSTAIEGSTLTELDTQLLFDEGVTAKGKPLVHHLMNEDLKQAYELAKTESGSLVPITPAFLKRLNAMLMRTTGSVHSVMGGSFDSSKGEFYPQYQSHGKSQHDPSEAESCRMPEITCENQFKKSPDNRNRRCKQDLLSKPHTGNLPDCNPEKHCQYANPYIFFVFSSVSIVCNRTHRPATVLQ